MIQLISGACRVGSKLMRPADKPFSMSKEEEEYLVKQGVAKYVPEETSEEDVATPPAPPKGEGTSVTQSDKETGTEGTQDGAGKDEGVLSIVDGHYVKEELLKLTRPELNEMAANLGLDGEGCDNKGQVADLIVGIQVAGYTDDQMPDLGAAGPVV